MGLLPNHSLPRLIFLGDRIENLLILNWQKELNRGVRIMA